MAQQHSGFASVGHLLANNPRSKHLQVLKHYCTFLFCNVDDSFIQKSSGFIQFDEFFTHVQPSVDAFAKFVKGVLISKQTDVEKLFQLQILIEKVVWDLVKYDFDSYVEGGLDRNLIVFRLFCLFNRFCKSSSLPMVLSEKIACFLCKELDIPFIPLEEEGNNDVDIHKFLGHVVSVQHLLNVRRVKKCYDEYVRDIIKEGRCRCRMMEKGQAKTSKTISITSRNLIIYGETDNLDEPYVTEPTGKKLHEIPLFGIEPKVMRGMFGKSKMYLQLVPHDNANAPIMELIFDQVKDHYDLYSWSQAIQESCFMTTTNTNRLYKTLIRLGLKVESLPSVIRSNVYIISSQGSPVTLTGFAQSKFDHLERCSSQANIRLNQDEEEDSLSTISSRSSPLFPMAINKMRSIRSSSSLLSFGSSSGSSTISSSNEDIASKFRSYPDRNNDRWIKRRESGNMITRTY